MEQYTVSDRIVRFLAASPSDSEFDSQVAFEIFNRVDNATGNSVPDRAIAIIRCLDNPEKFLISSVANLELETLESGKVSYKYSVQGAEEVMSRLALPDETPLYDTGHFGPFGAQTALTFLELVHASYSAKKINEALTLLKRDFATALQQDTPSPLPPAYETEGDIIRPTIWNPEG